MPAPLPSAAIINLLAVAIVLLLVMLAIAIGVAVNFARSFWNTAEAYRNLRAWYQGVQRRREDKERQHRELLRATRSPSSLPPPPDKTWPSIRSEELIEPAPVSVRHPHRPPLSARPPPLPDPEIEPPPSTKPEPLDWADSDIDSELMDRPIELQVTREGRIIEKPTWVWPQRKVPPVDKR